MTVRLTVLLATWVSMAVWPMYAGVGWALNLTDKGNRVAQTSTDQSRDETILFFETESRVVRVFRRGSHLRMNVYNKTTEEIEANRLQAESISSDAELTIYRSSQAETQYFAAITIAGETALEIVSAEGTVALQEPGFNAVVGVPEGNTHFRGRYFPPGTAAIVISSRYANLRSQPALDSEVLGNAPRREVVDVVDRVGNPTDGFLWYQVTYNGILGWVRGDLLQPLQSLE